MDYCRYVRSNALHEFQVTTCRAAVPQNQKEVARYLQKTQTFNDGIIKIYKVTDTADNGKNRSKS